MKIPIFTGKYHQHGWSFQPAMLVYLEVKGLPFFYGEKSSPREFPRQSTKVSLHETGATYPVTVHLKARTRSQASCWKVQSPTEIANFLGSVRVVLFHALGIQSPNVRWLGCIYNHLQNGRYLGSSTILSFGDWIPRAWELDGYGPTINWIRWSFHLFFFKFQPAKWGNDISKFWPNMFSNGLAQPPAR